ncbi:autophagy-related protein 18 [[Candida] anglica]|uniref:Autophagy-related protein 18 n=1 Tax=[Candida] anglica TaxID=148631 RepID=A0ABP0E9R9_9ASCO
MVTINNLTFNQDYSCLSVCTDQYYKIFNCDPFGEFYSSIQSQGTGNNSGESKKYLLDNDGQQGSPSYVPTPASYLKMLFSTSLTIIVPENPMGNRLLKLYNLKQNLKICELTFPAHIIDVKLNRKRLCVILESGQIYIYDLSCVRLVKVLDVVATGKSEFVGDLCADDKSLLVLPLGSIKESTDLFNHEHSNTGSQPSTPMLDPTTLPKNLADVVEFTRRVKSSKVLNSVTDLNNDSEGWVLVYDTLNLRPSLIYRAHDSSIAKLSISSDGTKIASASTKGTIIRTCTVEANEELNGRLQIVHMTNLRRGHHLTKVTCLSFSLDNAVLGCASESGTIHFFKLSTSEELSDPSLDDDSSTENISRSSEDLNDNLASLLLSEGGTYQHPQQLEQEQQIQQQNNNTQKQNSYFYNIKNSMSILNNQYTQSLVKKLPYKGYLENLWEPPRRSFAYVKIPEPEGSRIEIGFTSSMQVVLTSYRTGAFYQYHLPSGYREREEAILVGEYLVI